MNYKNKKILVVLLLVFALFTSSCSSDENEIVFSGNNKSISKAAYQYFYTQNLNTIVEQYKSYYDTYGSSEETFKSYFGFIPDGTDSYWENDFLNEKIFENNTLTVGQYLDKSTSEACKEYIVLEKIAKEYGYNDLPEEVKKEYDDYIQSYIEKFGSKESWNVATIAQYGLTADEIMEITLVSLYNSFLPAHILGENGENISDEKSLKSLESAIQFKYSIYYYLTEDDLKNNEGDESKDESNDENDFSSTDAPSDSVVASSGVELDISDTNDNLPDNTSENNEKTYSEDVSDKGDDNSSEISTSSSDLSMESSDNNEESLSSEEIAEELEKFNSQYRDKMKADYEAILSGEKTFDDVYKESDEYEYWNKNFPDGALLEIVDFENFFKIDKESYKPGDVLYIESEIGVYLIQILPFSESYIDDRKSSLIIEEFKTIVEKYFDDVVVNKELLSSLTKYTED